MADLYIATTGALTLNTEHSAGRIILPHPVETLMPTDADPTWYSDIRQMFNTTDVAHMGSQDLDLTSYDSVVANAGDIYAQVAMGNMPIGAPWTTSHPDWIPTFLNWMTNQFPKGAPPAPTAAGTRIAAASAKRIRKNINSLSQSEIATLKTAFTTIIRKNSDDPNSYFVQAGHHWLPSPIHCQHHVPAYNPWHRAYLLGFENALRLVPGCEDVTLPYWDITTPFPELLKHPPFDSYTLPKDIGGDYKAGYVTTRYPYDDIQQSLSARDVTGKINRALGKSDWEDFHGLFAGAPNNTIIAAHDDGHDSIGLTMSDPAAAAFDPVFFFFHANWDRLFWKWQQRMQATNQNGLLTTINKTKDPVSYQTFTNPVLETLAPFTANPPHLNAVQILDSVGTLDVDYEEPEAAVATAMLTKRLLTTAAAKPFTVAPDLVDVRVDGINRLKIPGSFSVHLLKDGKRIATTSFFQPVEPEKCPNCVDNAIVHFDFELPLADVKDGRLSIEVEPTIKSFVGARFPPKMMGDPAVSVRLLMQHE